MQWQLPPPLDMGIDRPAALSGLQLAYIGDAVYELWVRTYLSAKGVAKVKDLHQGAVSFVRADTQAALVKKNTAGIITGGKGYVHQRAQC